MEKKPMYLMTYDHGGYVLWGEHFAERLASGAQWLRKYPKFKMGLDNEAYCYDAYARENPEILKKMQDMLKLFPGRFAIGSATYGQPLSAFIDHESNVRQLTYAVAVEQKYFGTRPPVYAMSEHAMHAQIPQLAAGCGYGMAIMRTHFQMYGYNPTYPVSFGTWVGLDGTRIPTVPTYDEEGAHFGRTTIDNWVLTRWPREAQESPEDLEAMFAHIDPLLASRLDDVVLRCEELTAFAEGKEHYHWVILEDLPTLYRGLEDQMDFVTKPRDFSYRMPWGYCGNVIFRRTLDAQNRVQAAERAAALAKLLGFRPDQNLLDDAWKNLLVAQHHDIQICGLYKEADRYLTAARAAADRLTDQAMCAMAEAMGGDAAQQVLVVNPLARASRQWVTAEVSSRGEPDLTRLAAVCGDTVIPCRIRVLERRDDGVTPSRVLASFPVELEGFQARVFRFTTADGPSEALTSLTFRPGADGSFDILDGEQVLLSGGCLTGAVAGTDWESKGCWQSFETEGGTQWEMNGNVGPLPCTIRVRLEGMQAHITTLTRHHGEEVGIPREYDSFWNNRNGFVHEEKLRFRFAPGLDMTRAQGITTGPFYVAEAEGPYVEGCDFTALRDGSRSVTLLQDGGKCLTREGQYLSIPLAFYHKYAWGAKALWGEIENRFVLDFGCGDTAQMLRASEEYRLPFLTRSYGPTKTGTCCEDHRFLTVQADGNIALSALAPSEQGLALRLWETDGREGSVCVSCPSGKGLRQTDLLGKPLGAAPAALEPHRILTLELEL